MDIMSMVMAPTSVKIPQNPKSREIEFCGKDGCKVSNGQGKKNLCT